MEKRTKQLLIYICIGIIILIIVRFIYLNQYNIDKNVEHFIVNNNNAVDLLSTKLKSTDALQYSTTASTNSEMIIHSWSNKLYNIQTTTLQQIKPIALYKPNLSINSDKYCKLGDMISQDVNYNPPSSSEFTLLIKKIGSDIKPPKDYSLIVDTGDKNIDTDYYNYVTYFNDISNINKISSSLSKCSTALTQLGLLVQTNTSLIQNALKNKIYKTATVTVGDIKKKVLELSKLIVIPLNSNPSINIKLPAGINAGIIDLNYYNYNVDISISKNLDAITTGNDDILNALPSSPFFDSSSVTISREQYQINIFDNIPSQSIVDYIKILCLDIKNIYDNNISLQYLNLAVDKDTVIAILNTINSIANINTLNLSTTFTQYKNNTTLLGNIINIILTASISYNLTYVSFSPINIAAANPVNVTAVPIHLDNPGNLVIASFTNDIISNMNTNSLDININAPILSTINTLLNSIFPKINKLIKFSIVINNKTINEFPLQIYNPLPPDGYLSLGHVFCNIASDLDKIKAAQNVACVPFNCVKEIRDWLPSDKIYEYNKNNVYWAIYLNPYTGTFISTNKPQVPAGKVSKVVACVAKCTAVDNLKKADDCARKYYNINKKVLNNTPIIPNLVNDQEEEFYLNKIKTQSDSIAKLDKRAQQMQLTMDKAIIINKEMNKNKLQNYVDTQKTNIGIITQQLIDDRNKIQTNINIPIGAGAINTSDYQQNLNKVLGSCPEYDLTGLVKKSTVSDVCYGCDSPP